MRLIRQCPLVQYPRIGFYDSILLPAQQGVDVGEVMRTNAGHNRRTQ